MKWSVGTKIGAGFGLAIAVLILFGFVTYSSTNELDQTSQLEGHSRQVLKTLEDINSDIANLDSAQRGFIITGHESYLEPYRQIVGDIGQKVSELRKLVAGSANQQRKADALESL